MQTVNRPATTLACFSSAILLFTCVLVLKFTISNCLGAVQGVKGHHQATSLASSSSSSSSSGAAIRIESPVKTRQQQVSRSSNDQAEVEQQQQQQQQQHKKQFDSVQYGIVVDCGSSGTRATIYTWPANVKPEELAYFIEALRDPETSEPVSIRIRPGLASVRGNPNYASDYMRPIMEFASSRVPASKQASTPVYIMGTAGMRLLTSDEQLSIIEDLRHDLRREFSFKNISAQVISGIEEGVFQWVSVNALTNRLTSQFDLNSPPGSGSSSSSSSTSLLASKHKQARWRKQRRLGLIEMGGASAQVAFEVSPLLGELIGRRLKHQGAGVTRLVQTSRLDVNLYGDKVPDVSVFSVSFLGFGSDSVRALAIDLIVRNSLAKLNPFVAVAAHAAPAAPAIGSPEENSNSTTKTATTETTKLVVVAVDDPCLPLGSHEIVQKPLELFYKQAPTIGYQVEPQTTTTTTTTTDQSHEQQIVSVRLIGSGNYAHCQVLLNRLVGVAKREQTTCNRHQDYHIRGQPPCEAPLIGTNFIPWHHFQWVGLGELYYTPSVMFNSTGHLNWSLVQFKTAKLCSTVWQNIQSQYPAKSEFEQRRNLLACFKATWLITWLSTILRMPMGAGSFVDFQTTKQVDGTDVDWKLGAIITKTVNGG